MQARYISSADIFRIRNEQVPMRRGRRAPEGCYTRRRSHTLAPPTRTAYDLRRWISKAGGRLQDVQGVYKAMISTTEFARGGYSFIKGVFSYSAGVAALPGFRIDRVRFATLMPRAEGVERIEAIIKYARRPLTALCSCELRSPAPFTAAGFRQFNELYVAMLEKWGLIEGGDNPVARSNVCPALDPPPQPGFYAFSFTTDAQAAPRSLFVAASAESLEAKS